MSHFLQDTNLHHEYGAGSRFKYSVYEREFLRRQELMRQYE